jgi:hypothetical protein
MAPERNRRWYDPTSLAGGSPTGQDTLMCPVCECTYFEQVKVDQYPSVHSVVLGQTVVPISDMGFVVFKCIKCSKVVEPTLLLGPQDRAHTQYNAFLDEMEVPLISDRDSPAKGEKL